jgi:hypothetical protein
MRDTEREGELTMDKDYIQMKADEDGCLYLFHKETGEAKKVINAGKLPPSIIEQIRILKKTAAVLPDV